MSQSFRDEGSNLQYRCPPPSVEFITIPNQETILSSPSQHHIQLYSNTFHHNTDLHGNPILSCTYHVHDLHLPNNSFARNLFTTLSECDIPQTHHPRILESIIAQVAEVILDEACYPLLPPCLFQVHVTCHKNYYGPENNIIIDEHHDGGMVPASEESIKSMLMNKFELQSDGIDNVPKSCPICLDEFLDYGGTSSSLGCMPCNHIFHQQCIVNWLRKSHYCPLCRFEMPTSRTN